MAASAPSPSKPGTMGAANRSQGFMANAMQRKSSFVQLFFMTGILMLSLRSLGQKYRIHDLTAGNSYLREEKESLSSRMAAIKESLLHEASLDPSGLLASHLRRLFGDTPN